MKHQKQHPLRTQLTQKDWQRIQQTLNGELDETWATLEEIAAAHDVLYDAIAGRCQTHSGITTLQ